ncbi:MAG TPA: Crp/Fnr family transcriptional regulator [Bacillus sp. (in: firmicutes)]|nr:Crp/Fnr family transcriptional regulator [Bacillus sp. (in: firmicutes)]
MGAVCTLNHTILANTVLFSKENLNRLKGIMYEKKVKSGTYLFEEGDLADKLYFIKEGSVNLSKVMDDGKELSFYHFGADDMFGEYQYVEGKKCMFNAVALKDCIVGVIQQQDLEVLLWQDGDFSIQFTKWLGYMQQFTQTKMRDLMFFGKNGALASTLIRMTNTYGKADGNVYHITRKFTNEEIAGLIGATRETVNRMLSQLKKEGIVGYDKGSFIILDLEALRNICHCEDCPRHVCRL